MNPNYFWGIVAGVMVGVLSGLVGVGGGVVMVPILVYFFGMNQHQAQGTSLAMLLPPSGLLAFLKYYKAGDISLTFGLIMALGVFIGGYFGGALAQHISDNALRKVFAVVLVFTAVKMFLQE
jgi:uncharacterized membrane protein YfcA